MKKVMGKKWTAVLLAGVLFVAGCGSTDADESANTASVSEESAAEETTEEETVIRVGYFNNSVWNAALDAAYQAGYLDEVLADANASVELYSFENGPAATEAFLSDEIDIVYGIGDQPVVTALEAGQVDISIVAVASIVTDIGIVAGTDSGVTSMDDLAGHTIGVQIGTAAHKTLLHLLEDYGYTEDDVELVNISSRDTELTALINGEIDTGLFNAYSYAMAEENGYGTIIGDGSAHPMYLYVEASNSFIDAHEELLELFIEGCRLGEELLDESPEEAYSLIAELTGVDYEQVEVTSGNADYSVQLTEASIQNLYDTAEFLYEQGLVETQVSEETIDANILDLLEITE